MLSARLRNGSGWTDACILNISSRGMLVYVKGGARPGSYVELRKGDNRVVARVIWRNNNRIGLCSADPLPVAQIISSETAVAAAASSPALAGRIRERRNRLAPEERSRARSRAMEFLSLVLIGTAIAGTAAVYVQQVMSKPLARVIGVIGS